MTEPISGAGIAASIGSKAVSELNKAGAFEQPIKILNEILYITIGHRTELKAQKLELTNKLNFQKFSKDLGVKVSKISEEDIQEPPINIAGPALEASKFHMNEDEIREMFAQLIASSMDRSQDSNIHPSFVEIIKMLSPLDARYLKHLFSKMDNQPIVNIKRTTPHDGSYIVIRKHVLLAHKDSNELVKQEMSIDNLIRLRLVEVAYDMHLTDKDHYAPYEQMPLYRELKKHYGTYNDQSNEESYEIEIGKGYINLTSFGSAFCKVCL